MIQGISYTRITLALDIVKKLTNGVFAGYHELGIIKHQIDLGDTITIEKSANMKVYCSHPQVPEDATNICWQVAEMLKKEFNVKENVSIHIDKKIPVQGGLAGGSANAAETMKLLLDLWKIEITLSQKIALSRRVGMDVPFYFLGKTAFDSEATGLLRSIKNNVAKLHFLLVIPSFGVSTKDAYSKIDYSKIGKKVDLTMEVEKGILLGDFETIKEGMHNDFEHSVFSNFPKLSVVRDNLLKFGASSAIMSGSGSTILGLFKDFKTAKDAETKFEKALCVSSL